MTSTVFYRPGGLNLTRRWVGTQVKDVGDWADGTVLEIHMAQGLAPTPMILSVRRFIPAEGDVLVRRWVDNGVAKEHVLPPYALADIRKTAVAFEKYLREHAFEGLSEAVKDSDELIKRTYNMAFMHYNSLPVCLSP